MAETSSVARAPRHSILDLAPLELDCMTAIWALGAGTVRDVQEKLMPTRPRAYTTVMTIMDRLAQKGIVSRQKVGRAYRYQATLSSDDARNNAVQKVVTGFFNGSAEALASHLATSQRTERNSVIAGSAEAHANETVAHDFAVSQDPRSSESKPIEPTRIPAAIAAAVPPTVEDERDTRVIGQSQSPARLDESLL
jgi:predicted transcriptional regulator